MDEEFAIFSGNASRTLAEAVARALGAKIGAATIERFPDGEVHVDIRETVRDKDIFLIQSTAPPVNDPQPPPEPEPPTPPSPTPVPEPSPEPGPTNPIPPPEPAG